MRSRIDFVITEKNKKKNAYICINLIASIQIEFLLNKNLRNIYIQYFKNIFRYKIHQKSIYIRNIVKLLLNKNSEKESTVNRTIYKKKKKIH